MGCRRMAENQGTVVNLGRRMSRAGGSQSFMIPRHPSLTSGSLAVSHPHTLTPSLSPHPHTLTLSPSLHPHSLVSPSTHSHIFTLSPFSHCHILHPHTVTPSLFLHLQTVTPSLPLHPHTVTPSLLPQVGGFVAPNAPPSRRESEIENPYHLNTIRGIYTFTHCVLTHTHTHTQFSCSVFPTTEESSYHDNTDEDHTSSPLNEDKHCYDDTTALT